MNLTEEREKRRDEIEGYMKKQRKGGKKRMERKERRRTKKTNG